MFEELFEQPRTIKRYRSAPLYEDRVRYLAHMAEGGAKPPTLYNIAYNQLKLVRLVDLREGQTVTVSQLAAVAEARSPSRGIFRQPADPIGGVSRLPRIRASMAAFSGPRGGTLGTPSSLRRRD